MDISNGCSKIFATLKYIEHSNLGEMVKLSDSKYVKSENIGEDFNVTSCKEKRCSNEKS